MPKSKKAARAARTSSRTTRRARPRRRFVARTSAIHGRGVFALANIKKGERIIEYKGERISNAEADRRYADDDSPHTFLFYVNKKVVIDATYNGNTARWINHSCDPNCETDDENERIYITAIKNIKPGEELTYDYQLFLGERHTPAAKKAHACYCRTRKCRGTMLGKKR